MYAKEYEAGKDKKPVSFPTQTTCRLHESAEFLCKNKICKQLSHYVKLSLNRFCILWLTFGRCDDKQ